MSQEQIAGVLEGHPHWEWSIGDHAVICGGCHWTKRIPIEVSATDTFRAHQAAVLAPLIVAAQAEALRDAADAPLPAPERKGMTSGFRFWLRNRAATLEAEADPEGLALVQAIHDRKAQG
ncbi:hypothetical protein [Arthrobacter sp. UYCu723]